jgi:O-antigen/teichoic acid export membrane protein
MMAITLLTLLLTQVDKILLSRLLTLESFGYYALAWALANALNMLAMPITGALYPRFTELTANHDDVALRTLYHQGAQLVTVLNGSAAMILMVFSDRILRLWTGNPVLTQHVAPVMSLLALGMTFSGMMAIPYQLQLAHGWTSLTIKVNIVSVGLLVPTILLVAPTYGALGTAWVWVALNVGYVLLAIPLMHRRLLRAEKWRWYGQDIALPLAAAATTSLLCRWVMPRGLDKLGEFAVLLISSICVLLAATATAPAVRIHFNRYLPISRLGHALSLVSFGRR